MKIKYSIVIGWKKKSNYVLTINIESKNRNMFCNLWTIRQYSIVIIVTSLLIIALYIKY